MAGWVWAFTSPDRSSNSKAVLSEPKTARTGAHDSLSSFLWAQVQEPFEEFKTVPVNSPCIDAGGPTTGQCCSYAGSGHGPRDPLVDQVAHLHAAFPIVRHGQQGEISLPQVCSTTRPAVERRSHAAGVLALYGTHSETFVVLVAAQVKNGEIIAAGCVAGATAIGEVFVQATPHTYSKRMHFWCFKCKSRQTRDYANSCYQS